MVKNYKIIDVEDSYYFQENTDNIEYYSGQRYEFFSGNEQASFLNELSKHRPINKQAGYSKKRECEYISIILITKSSIDGEFCGINNKSTCIINKDNEIRDVHENVDQHEEYTLHHEAIYHHLPDNKVVEILLGNGEYYENEIKNIYDLIKRIRSYYDLDASIPKKSINNTKKLKL